MNKTDVKSIVKHELIGLNAEIVDSKNKANLGIKGKITDETKHTILIAGKRVFKNNITLKIDINKKQIKINGQLLSGRPKERIKQK